jgi:PemK-like, MazF-like toxin of type II toxin-antitoxin system
MVLALMQVRSCRVTIRDIDGLTHSVDVTAATLFVAVAQAIAALRRDDWVADIPRGQNVVNVSVANVRMDHQVSGVNVDLAKFNKVPSTWVRVITQGEPGYALVEQVRCIDRSRCGAQIGELVEDDLKLIENNLKHLLFQ